ncbi:MAG: FHA domain-containing protein [Thermoflexales bacterium]|nr:FHA domain-containing protein [Thermoflexales bacterium]
MPRLDQLEVISHTGAVAFHDLDPGKGITNIGRHPENDIVIDSPSVADFHAILDHRQKPYHFMLLDQAGGATLGGQPLQANLAREVQYWDTIEIDGHAIVLLQDDGSAPAPIAPAPRLGAPLPTPVIAPIAPAGLSNPIGLATRLPMQPADQSDDVIIADLSQRDWIIDCEQTATCQVTIINGGDLVASFEVSVEGLDPDWVIIAPPTVNLNEGERGTVTIGIMPPRRSSSRAGAHHFNVRVTSPNYPSRTCGHGATLTINPYYEFAVGDLSPRQQTVTWTRRTGQAALAIANQGNAEATFRLDGEDDQRGCAFEFQLPGGTAGRSARQAEIRVPPDAVSTVPIFITPLKRRLIGLRKHTYALTITNTLLQGQQTPRSVFGTLAAAPLIGLGLLLLIGALLIVLVYVIFHPYIDSFRGPNGCKTDCIVDGGKPIELSWSASPFANLKLEQSPNTGSFQVVAPVDGPTAAQNLTPLSTITYRLVGDNFLSTLFPSLQAVSDPVIIVVRPSPPIIVEFKAEGGRNQITLGESITLFWRVVNADKLLLSSNGIEQSVTPTDTGTLIVKPDTSTTYLLNATNGFGPAVPPGSLKLNVVTPTPTPAPKPVIVQFNVEPRVITAGQSVKILWEVTGAPNIRIVNVPGADKYPLKGDISQSPTQKTVYQLIASNGQPGPENEVQSAPMEVDVLPAPPPPVAPRIDFFLASPNTVVRGSKAAKAIVLSWQITGQTTAIELSGPDIGKIAGLKPSGEFTVAAEKSTLYVLSAFNGELNTTAVQQLTVNEPTPTPTPPPTATPLPPAPVIDYFQAVSASGTASDVIQDLSTNIANTLVYTVVAGTPVEFRWLVRNSTAVLFDGASVAAINDSPSSQIVPGVKQPKTYELRALNAIGTTTLKFVKIVIQQKAPPPRPFNVNGTDSAAPPLLLTWQYNAADVDKIVGFRVYRATVPNTTFDRVADYDTLDNAARQFADPLDNPPSPTCGLAYYVVAISLDADGNPVESQPSSNSWYSSPCP